MRKFLFALLLLIPGLLICSCGYSYEDFYGGTPVDSSALAAARELMEQTAAEKYPAVTDADGNAVVFWTPSGEVYHTSDVCFRLNNSKIIQSGSIDEALAAGKNRGCPTCVKE